MIRALVPQAGVVLMASATSRVAPRAEFADPLRSLVVTITGADQVVDAVASNALTCLCARCARRLAASRSAKHCSAVHCEPLDDLAVTEFLLAEDRLSGVLSAYVLVEYVLVPSGV
jgi:hypothetical protein